MSKRYYKLDTSTGKVRASYARFQPNIPDLVYMEEPTVDPTLPVILSSSGWVPDVEEYKLQKINEARTLAVTRFIDSSKAVTAIQANYNVFKNASYSTIEEVDNAFDVFVAFMNLS